MRRFFKKRLLSCLYLNLSGAKIQRRVHKHPFQGWFDIADKPLDHISFRLLCGLACKRKATAGRHRADHHNGRHVDEQRDNADVTNQTDK